MTHLTDHEIASFIDGNSTNRKKAIKHLNICSYCFEVTIATIQTVETEKELCKELDTNFQKWAEINLT